MGRQGRDQAMSRERATTAGARDRRSSRRPAAASAAPDRTARKRTAAASSGPRGRDQITDAIIEATIELCKTGGPDKVTLRRVAEQANVNYGLVHRHFGTKAAVITAAMRRAHERSFHDLVEASEDLATALRRILLEGSNTLSRVMAWGTLQDELENVLPAEESALVLTGLSDLAAKDLTEESAADSLSQRAFVGTLVAALLGWRLFEPYLVRGLHLEEYDRSEIYKAILPILQGLVDQHSR
jgi:TetR/AcrR family transcriptional regulator, repressor for neighboring sulfatase